MGSEFFKLPACVLHWSGSRPSNGIIRCPPRAHAISRKEQQSCHDSSQVYSVGTNEEPFPSVDGKRGCAVPGSKPWKCANPSAVSFVPFSVVASNPSSLPPTALMQFNPLPELSVVSPAGGAFQSPIQVQGSFQQSLIPPAATGGSSLSATPPAGHLEVTYDLHGSESGTVTRPGPSATQPGALSATSISPVISQRCWSCQGRATSRLDDQRGDYRTGRRQRAVVYAPGRDRTHELQYHRRPDAVGSASYFGRIGRRQPVDGKSHNYVVRAIPTGGPFHPQHLPRLL